MDRARIDVIERLYAAVCEDSQWEPALQALSHFVGGAGVVHMASNPARGIVTAAEAVGVQPGQVRQFQEHFADKEIRLAPALRYAVGVPIIDWEMLSTDVLRRSVIFNEFLVPNGIPHLLGVWLQKAPTVSASLSFQGTGARGPFTVEDAERLRSVVPHLLRAYEARRLLTAARVTRFAYRHLLDGLPFGVILLDGAMRVIDATAPAERVLQENSALGYFEGRIRAIHLAEHKLLSGALEAVCKGITSSVGATIRLRQSSRERLTLTIVPVPKGATPMMGGCCRCMVLVYDPRTKVRVQASVLQSVFALTHAEALLAVELARSPTLRDAATAVGRTYNTCKTQVRSIYTKMQVNSQLELAQKIVLTSIANSVG